MLFNTYIPWCLSNSDRHFGSELVLAKRIAALLRQLPVFSLDIYTNFLILLQRSVRIFPLRGPCLSIITPNRLQVLQNKFY